MNNNMIDDNKLDVAGGKLEIQQSGDKYKIVKTETVFEGTKEECDKAYERAAERGFGHHHWHGPCCRPVMRKPLICPNGDCKKS